MKFYKLTEADLPRIFEMNHSELKVYCWLNVHLPFDDSKAIEIDTAQLAEEIGISRRSVQRALKSLESRNLFDIEITKAKVKRQTTQKAPDDTDAVLATQMSPKRHRCRRDGADVAETAQMSPAKAETRSVQDFQLSKTYSDFLQTLSEDEREIFGKFSRKAAAQLHNPEIVLVEKWIADNHQWLYQEFQKTYSSQATNSGGGQFSGPPISKEKNELHPLIAEGLESGVIDRLDPCYNGLFDAAGNWWKIEDWLEKPSSKSVEPTEKEKFASQFKKLVERFQIPTGPENAQNSLDWALSLGPDPILLNDRSIRSRLEQLAREKIIELVFDGSSISEVKEVE